MEAILNHDPNVETWAGELVDALIDGVNPIKLFSESRGLTQDALAKKCKTSAAYISQLETNRQPGAKLLIRLAAALNVDPELLIAR